MPNPWEIKWIVGEQIGKGGQGLTYLVTSVANHNQQAVLKKLKNNKDKQARGRMHREVASLETLHNDGGSVPRVFDHNGQFYEDDNVQLYLVMEYIPGQTLRETLNANGPLSLDVSTRIINKIAETIRIAHKYPLLHRDLKPENIIIRDLNNANVFILDYGLSFNAEVDEDVTDTSDTFRNKFLDLPETNTPGGNRRDSRSDITAACGILYYLLTGHAPGQLYGGDGQLPHRRKGHSIRERMPDDPRISQLEIFFDRGFNPNIEDRFQTINEFLERLNLITNQNSQSEIEDPIEVAERESIRLRQYDRKSQLEDFLIVALDIIMEIPKIAGHYAGKLKRFEIITFYNLPSGGMFGGPVTRVITQDLAIPSGIDEVPQARIFARISPKSHNHLSRLIQYSIGSKGMQCVILRARYIQTNTDSQNSVQGTLSTIMKPVENLKELLWYEGETKPDLTLLKNDFESWLGESMRELVDELKEQPWAPNNGRIASSNNW